MCAPILPFLIPTLLGVGASLLMNKGNKAKQPNLAPVEKPINKEKEAGEQQQVEADETKIKDKTAAAKLPTDLAPSKTSDLQTDASGINDPLKGIPGGRPSPTGLGGTP